MAVEGLTDLLRKMRAIPDKIEVEVKAEMEKMAADMVRQMRAIAPKGETGALAASIDWTWGAAPKGTMTIGTVGAAKPGGGAFSHLVLTIYTGGKVNGMDAFYARFQEFGTRKMAANPFFFPVYRANRTRARSGLSRAVRRAVKNA